MGILTNLYAAIAEISISSEDKHRSHLSQSLSPDLSILNSMISSADYSSIEEMKRAEDEGEVD